MSSRPDETEINKLKTSENCQREKKFLKYNETKAAGQEIRNRYQKKTNQNEDALPSENANYHRRRDVKFVAARNCDFCSGRLTSRCPSSPRPALALFRLFGRKGPHKFRASTLHTLQQYLAGHPWKGSDKQQKVKKKESSSFRAPGPHLYGMGPRRL